MWRISYREGCVFVTQVRTVAAKAKRELSAMEASGRFQTPLPARVCTVHAWLILQGGVCLETLTTGALSRPGGGLAAPDQGGGGTLYATPSDRPVYPCFPAATQGRTVQLTGVGGRLIGSCTRSSSCPCRSARAQGNFSRILTSPTCVACISDSGRGDSPTARWAGDGSRAGRTA